MNKLNTSIITLIFCAGMISGCDSKANETGTGTKSTGKTPAVASKKDGAAGTAVSTEQAKKWGNMLRNPNFEIPLEAGKKVPQGWVLADQNSEVSLAEGRTTGTHSVRLGKDTRLTQFANTNLLKDVLGGQVAVTVWAKSNKKTAGPVARFEMTSKNPKESIAYIVGQPKKHMNLAAGSEEFIEFTSVLDVPTTVTSMRLDLTNRSYEDGTYVFFDDCKIVKSTPKK